MSVNGSHASDRSSASSSCSNNPIATPPLVAFTSSSATVAFTKAALAQPMLTGQVRDRSFSSTNTTVAVATASATSRDSEASAASADAVADGEPAGAKKSKTTHGNLNTSTLSSTSPPSLSHALVPAPPWMPAPPLMPLRSMPPRVSSGTMPSTALTTQETSAAVSSPAHVREPHAVPAAHAAPNPVPNVKNLFTRGFKQKEITDWKGGDLMPEAMVKLGAIIERVLRECEDNVSAGHSERPRDQTRAPAGHWWDGRRWVEPPAKDPVLVQIECVLSVPEAWAVARPMSTETIKANAALLRRVLWIVYTKRFADVASGVRMQELPLQPDSVAARRTELRRTIEALELHKVLTPEQLKEVEQKGVEISEVAALAHAAAAAQHLNGQAAVAMTDAARQEALSVAESGNLVRLLPYIIFTNGVRAALNDSVAA